MPTIEVSALSETRKLLGYHRRSIQMERGTLADLLRSLETLDGSNLYSHLVCDGKFRGHYAVVVNGLSIQADQLDRPLSEGEQVVMMALVPHRAGG